MSFQPTIRTLLQTMQHKGYRVYDAPDGFDLNLVGVRTRSRLAGRFDDFLTAFYRSHGEWILNVFPATTDPGSYWLQHPRSHLGAAILKEGQYLKAYRVGKHRNHYQALVQRDVVTVIRDANRDEVLDLDSGREETGFFGINIHRAAVRNRPIDVGRWSAGCQVVADPWQFDLLLDLCREGRRRWGNAFTYTLLHERDFEEAMAIERVLPRRIAELPRPELPTAPSGVSLAET